MVNAPSKELQHIIRQELLKVEKRIKEATGLDSIRVTAYEAPGNDKSPVVMMYMIADRMGMRYVDFAYKSRETKYVELRRVAILCLMFLYPAITYKKVAELIGGGFTYEDVMFHYKKGVDFMQTKDEIFCTLFDPIYEEVEAWMKG